MKSGFSESDNETEMYELHSLYHVGKSTTLKNIMATFGAKQIYSPKTTESAIMEQAANTTIPLGI